MTAKNPHPSTVPASWIVETAAAEMAKSQAAEIATLRQRNTDLHAQLLRAQCELEKIKTLADAERCWRPGQP